MQRLYRCMNSVLSIAAAVSLLVSISPTSVGAEYASIIHNQPDTTKKLAVGDKIRDFIISTPLSPDGLPQTSLAELLEDGPVILTFFRGSWCPYCRGELSSIQDRIDDFHELGASILAVSPEIDKESIELGKELDLGFAIGHDENNELARSLGLTFKLDAKTINQYRKYGIDVPESNGTKTWELPIPATYVIDQDMTVRFVFDDENYAKRANFKKVLKLVKDLVAED